VTATVYCSPSVASVPGSLHGYDVVDHRRLRDDLGGDAAFERFVAALGRHGLGQIVSPTPRPRPGRGSVPAGR
jgi:(1->4)-alpha-D-glucan 1-alpha-D-glucosylmutase